MVSKASTLYHHCSVDCHPGGRWGKMERAVAQWQHPVASGIALDMLHPAMPSILHHCTVMAIEMASNGGTFVRCCYLFCLIKTELKDHVMVHLN